MNRIKIHRSIIFKYWTFVNAGLFFLIGIAMGFAFKVQRTVSLYSFGVQETFNWTLMLLIWFIGVISTFGVYAVYVHLNNQEQQIELLACLAGNQVNAGLKNITELHAQPAPQPASRPAPPSAAPTTDAASAAVPTAAQTGPDVDGNWTCSRCGHLNAADAMYCTVCGQSK